MHASDPKAPDDVPAMFCWAVYVPMGFRVLACFDP
jgi:hypothetical protein